MSPEAYGLMQAVCLLGITLVLLHWRWRRDHSECQCYKLMWSRDGHHPRCPQRAK